MLNAKASTCRMRRGILVNYSTGYYNNRVKSYENKDEGNLLTYMTLVFLDAQESNGESPWGANGEGVK